MKKTLVMAAIAAGSLLLASCGTGAGSSLGNSSTASKAATGAAALGGVASTLLSQSGNNNLSNIGGLASTGLSLLTNLLGVNTVNANSITGTWTYQQPHISFESNNVLSQIGGELMGNKISSMLGTSLEKIGLKKGAQFTFDGKGNMTVTVSGKSTKGTYTINGNQLTMTGALGFTNLTCTVSMTGNQLYMLFDASTLFGYVSKMGQNVSSIKSLLGSYNGMKMGWMCTR